MVSLTTSQVKKAGRTLRHWRSGQDVAQLAVNDAFDVLVAYRAVHSLPLVKANNGLRSMIRTAGCEVEVSQRLKRIPTILGKLVREPSLPLSSMPVHRRMSGDLGDRRRSPPGRGGRIRKNRPTRQLLRLHHHAALLGYLAVHVIVEYDDRGIEIQLRTRIMHQWAITVERLSWRTRMNLKTDGDHAIQRMMAVISHAMAIEEEGGVVPTEVLRSLKELRQEAQPYL